ncbi:MAG TPA: tetratricopeptide repeat protein [Planctomycetota bacterium]|nr:tetratricopeptide repeat protein [Planctomycetota bacterium]
MMIPSRARAPLFAAILLAPICWRSAVAAPPSASPAPLLLQEKSEKETLADARAALTAKDPQKAADLITAFLTRAVGTVDLEDVLGQALLQLGRKDEAAHHFELALKLVGDVEAPQKALKANLLRADPLYTRRSALMLNITKNLLENCQKLYETGHTERALSILTSLEPIASGAIKKSIVELATKIRAAKEAVNLDASGSDASSEGARPLVKLEGKHYHFESYLDQNETQRVSDVMDDIFNYYVQIYFDNDATRVNSQKPTIRILATHDDMMKEWPGEQRPGLGGWWSPSEWKVTCYDTGSESGSRDQMLMTLYHEASHNFMTMLAKGGNVPAWINEGTASFFEGATAMSDRKVLWPEAADGRLRALQYQLTGGRGPTVAEVLSFNEPGSYPGEYYSYGWGLVYFLQQYEDPVTLEYVFRPLYSTYRETIARTGAEPMELFKQTFLVPSAPGGAMELDAWVARWRNWILNEVYPLNHEGARRRDLRVDKAKMYIAAADKAKAEKTPKVPELELLTRALGHLEFIRKTIDGEDKIDPDLVVLQADVLERMGRPQGTAAVLEEVLDKADRGDTTLEPERYEELEKRLTKLDTKNQPLRLAKTRARNFANQAIKLMEQYQASETPMTLTSYEVSTLFADALDSKPLKEQAETLRLKARDAGLLHGALYRIGGRPSAWVTIFDNTEDKFDPGEGVLSIGGVRPVGRIFNAIPLSGEYELRCKLGRVGEISRTTSQGVVFSGTPTAQWFVAAIDGRGQLVVRRYEKGGSELGVKVDKLASLVAKDESPDFSVHVYADDRIVIKVGARPPVELKLEEPLPKTAYIGVFAKNGRTELSGTVLEVFP